MRSPGLMKRTPWGAPLVLSGALLMALTGCIDPGSGFSVFDRAAEAQDSLPAALPDSALDDIKPDTARFVAEDEGAELYLVQGDNNTRPMTCLLVYGGDAEWFTGCGAGQWFSVSGQSGSYEVRADSMPTPDGATELSPNVYIPCQESASNCLE